MKNQILNIGKALSKTEQKAVFGGRAGEEFLADDKPCSIYVPGTGWIAGYSVETAQFLFNSDEGEGYVTGWCCANCP